MRSPDEPDIHLARRPPEHAAGIVAALGAPRPVTMCDVAFSNLYVQLPAGADKMHLARTH
jgi:hypothetical protein